MRKREYRAVPVIPCEDDILHTTNYPFCGDVDGCPCHSDLSLFWHYCQKPYDSGLITLAEQGRIFRAEQLIVEAYWDRERAMP